MEDTTGGNESTIAQARMRDLAGIKRIADAHKHELGFVMRPAIIESITASSLLVARIVGRGGIKGFVRYHHRRDQVTKIYEICVHETTRGFGVGRGLLAAVAETSRAKGQRELSLKCPVDLAANGFYKRCGFRLLRIEAGKRRELNVWSQKLTT